MKLDFGSAVNGACLREGACQVARWVLVEFDERESARARYRL
jgi:hypothetical protein